MRSVVRRAYPGSSQGLNSTGWVFSVVSGATTCRLASAKSTIEAQHQDSRQHVPLAGQQATRANRDGRQDFHLLAKPRG